MRGIRSGERKSCDPNVGMISAISRLNLEAAHG